MHPHDYGLTKIAYSVNDLRALLPLGRTKLYQLIKAGLLRQTKVGKRSMFLATDVAALLAILNQEGR